MSGNLYEIVTLKIIEALNAGVIPWRKPWSSSMQLPCNLKTNRPYRGVNTLLLGLSKFGDHRWLTFNQAKELGGQVRSGEKSTMVVFWKFPDPKPGESEPDPDAPRPVPILRYFNVFNAEQIEGIDIAPVAVTGRLTEQDRIERAELLASSMPNPPFIEERGSEAWYMPEKDLIRIPKIEQFTSIDAYYGTKYHELAHATGHVTRLNRAGVMEKTHFGSEGYGKEELVAELASAFCCATVSLDNSFLQDSSSYIQGWLSVLKGDPKMLVYAAAQAQKAADFVKGVSY